jgi:hypothetical protein
MRKSLPSEGKLSLKMVLLLLFLWFLIFSFVFIISYIVRDTSPLGTFYYKVMDITGLSARNNNNLPSAFSVDSIGVQGYGWDAIYRYNKIKTSRLIGYLDGNGSNKVVGGNFTGYSNAALSLEIDGAVQSYPVHPEYLIVCTRPGANVTYESVYSRTVLTQDSKRYYELVDWINDRTSLPLDIKANYINDYPLNDTIRLGIIDWDTTPTVILVTLYTEDASKCP